MTTKATCSLLTCESNHINNPPDLDSLLSAREVDAARKSLADAKPGSPQSPLATSENVDDRSHRDSAENSVSRDANDHAVTEEPATTSGHPRRSSAAQDSDRHLSLLHTLTNFTAKPTLKSRRADQLSFVLASLKRMAQLRMRSLESGSAVKEQAKNMRRTQGMMFKEVRNLMGSMRKALSQMADADSGSAEVEDLTSWETCLSEIESLVTRAESAGESFDRQQRNAIDVDWDLCELEEDLYVQSTDWVLSDLDGHEQVSRRDGTHVQDSNQSHLARSPVASERASSMDAVSIDRRGNDEVPLGDNVGMFYSDYAASESAHSDSDNDIIGDQNSIEVFGHHESPPSKQEDKGTDQELNPGLTRDDAELSTLAGSQFIEINPSDTTAGLGLSDCEASIGFSDPSGFTEDDLNGLTRWLAYGTPWNHHSATNHDRLLSALTNFNFFRAWIWQSLGAVCSGQFSAPHVQAAEDERSFTVLADFVKLWFWDPLTGANTTDEPMQRRLHDQDTMRNKESATNEATRTARTAHPPSVSSVPPPYSVLDSGNAALLLRPFPLHRTAPLERRRSSMAIDARSEQCSSDVISDLVAQQNARPRRRSIH